MPHGHQVNKWRIPTQPRGAPAVRAGCSRRGAAGPAGLHRRPRPRGRTLREPLSGIGQARHTEPAARTFHWAQAPDKGDLWGPRGSGPSARGRRHAGPRGRLRKWPFVQQIESEGCAHGAPLRRGGASKRPPRAAFRGHCTGRAMLREWCTRAHAVHTHGHTLYTRPHECIFRNRQDQPMSGGGFWILRRGASRSVTLHT